MKTVTNIIYPALALLALSVFLTEARADCGQTGDIAFTVTLLNPIPSREGGRCFLVKGPWGRFGSVRIGDLTVGQPCTFYAADDYIWSAYGPWDLVVPNVPGDCLPIVGVVGIRKYKYITVNRGTNRVNVTLEYQPSGFFTIATPTGGNQRAQSFGETATDATNILEQSQTSSPTELSVNAWLGDSKDPSGTPDSDMFHFAGEAGDSVTVRLETDPRGGNNGGQATLRFVGPPTKQVSGELPKRVDVTLGSTGRYDIVVEQPGEQGEERYRGGYILTVESLQGNVRRLVPSNSVEK